jgi:hypothetical protein
MAIGNITRGSDFAGALSYVLDPDKKPKIISSCLKHELPHLLALEFHRVANLRPTVKKPVRHISIAFAPADGEIDDLVKEAIALRVLDGLGYGKSQYIAVAHDRNDPGHDEVHDHDHFHIITNAVTVEGGHVRDSYDMYRIQEILREVEREYGLQQVSSSWDVKKAKAKLQIDNETTRTIHRSFDRSADLPSWLANLALDGIDVRIDLSKNDNVKGITYVREGEVYKGSEIGARWQTVVEKLGLTDLDLDVIRATNRKTQALAVKLNPLDRQLFDRAIEMGLFKLGKSRRFKSCRVQIELTGNTLSMMRMRPHKLMLAAERTTGGWQPIGFPNLDRRDIELLERISGMKPQIPVQKSPATTSSYRVDLAIE